MKLDIYRTEVDNIGVCGYVNCKRPKTAIRHLRKAVENSKKLTEEEKTAVLEWVGDEDSFLETLYGIGNGTHADSGKEDGHAWVIELEEVLEGYYYISVKVKTNHEEENSNDEEVTASNDEVEEAEKEEVSNDKEAPSTLNFYSRKKSIKAWDHVKCKDGVTAIRHLRKAVETSDKLPDKDRKLLLEWVGDEKRFLEILDGYEHAYAVNHGWGIDLIEEIKGLWFISVYVRKNVEQ